MAAKKGGLGKGLDAMIPKTKAVVKEDNTENVTTSKSSEILININLIDTNRYQPRQNFKDEAIAELAESIKIHGIIEPLILQKKDDNRYEIIAGERRFRAAKVAKLKEVPAIIKDYEDQERFEIALIENIQREDLNSIEEAQAYKRLIEEYGLRQEELALRISKSRTAITNSMRLLKLDERVQQMVVAGELSGGHARTLLSIADENLQYETAIKVRDEELSVRETEKLVRAIINAKPAKDSDKKSLEDEALYKKYADNMISLVGTKVEIQRKDNNKGKVIINFSNADEFEKIYDIIRKGGQN